jgi:dihydroorotate dehydrogenase (fumarate)
VNHREIKISTQVSGLPLTSCLMNASGVWCKEADQLEALLEAPTGAVVTKSCTLEYREGNEEPRYRRIPNGSINSMGLPNNGIRYYLDFIEKHTDNNKPIFLSVAGLSHSENLELLKTANSCEELPLIELNLSCPNIAGKPQTGYDFEATKHLLEQAFTVCNKKIGVKLPPYFDMVHFEMMADVLRQFPIAYINSVNSIGNGLFIDVDTETVGIKPKNGFGGVGGLYIKPTALANVRKFYELLPGVDIIGCGGVQNGADAFEHILCGASVVQIGTTLWEEGPACFTRIEKELKEIMVHKGYSSMEEFKGKLKVME